MVGRTFEKHLGNLGLVLERLQNARLKVKPSKCALFQDQVCYLGHIISRREKDCKRRPQKRMLDFVKEENTRRREEMNK